MEKLRTHIEKIGMGQSAFAARIGVSKGYMSQILSGARQPSRSLIQKIEIATLGDVPATAWFSPTEGAE